ncbi:MAG TPA: hypothetical protein ENI85_00620 [Deltaproteobacteria bacterium]|nr:hypothetical protein [Deltaproteobacteria bacterium]
MGGTVTKTKRPTVLAIGLGCLSILLVTSVATAKPARLQPTRIASIGDSITRAFDSNVLLDNPSESWVNGYFGFWQWLLGFENVNSHNQRADSAFGVNANVNGAVNGADMDDMDVQAAAILSSSPYYVTVELGGNDICQDSIPQVPTPTDYVYDYIDGLLVLDPALGGGSGGLTGGATVFTASVPDIKQLYDVGKDQTGAFGLDCETIWLGTFIGFPCGSMLSPLNSESDRLALQAINLQYNQMLDLVSGIADDLSTSVYFDFTWSVWNHQFQGGDISSIDCFHPSSDGQRTLSSQTWADGPFSAF